MIIKFDLTVISKIIFLLFIISISVYFIFVNKNYNNIKYEQFTDQETTISQENNNLLNAYIPQDKNTIYGIIKDIYIQLYQTEPPVKISDFYYDYVSQRNITPEQLKEIIAGSNQTLQTTFAETNYTLPSQPALFGTEDDVVQIYNEILFRNPDENELYNFAKLLKEDSSFSIDKLKQIIYSSEEYQRLEKTQTNTVYSNIIGGVTDRQLSLIVTTIYKDVTGQDVPDSDTVHFLKKKLLEFNVNQTIFKEFIQNYMKNKPFTYTPPLVNTETIQHQQTNTNTITQEDLSVLKQDILKQVTQSLQNIPKKTDTGYTTNGQEQTQINPNRQVIEILLRTAKDNSKEDYLDSQNVLNKIKEEAKCVFDKNSTDNYYKSLDKQPSLSQLQDQRNTEELKNTCVRNQKFLGIDEDMVLDPSLKWSVPTRHPPICVGNKNDYKPIVDQTALIGTLLEDANETQVGSVLPEIPPR